MQQVEKKLIKLQEERKLNGENDAGKTESNYNNSQTIKRSQLDFSMEESNSIEKNENNLQRTPSPASSSVSISSSANTSSETTPPLNNSTNNNNNNSNNNILHAHQQNISSPSTNNSHTFNKCSLSLSPSHQSYQQQKANHQNMSMNKVLSPNRFAPSILAQQQQQQNQVNRYLSQQQQNIFFLNQQQNHIQLQQHLKQIQNTQQYNKKQNLSQSFKDILENTLMINNLNECYSNNIQNNKYPNNKNGTNGRYVKNLNKSTCSLNLNGTSNHNNNSNTSFSPQHHKLLSDAILFSQMPSTNLLDIDEADLDEEIFEQTISPVLPIENNNKANISIGKNESSSFSSPVNLNQSKIPSTPVLVNNQMAMKFAQLERTLEITKAQNNNLLEQQVSFKQINFKYI